MKKIETIIILGLILSFSAVIYTVTEYRISEMIARTLDEIKSTEVALNLNMIDSLEKSRCNSESIQLVNGRLKNGVATQKLLTTLAKDSKLNALTQGILWIGALLIFLMLFFKIKKIKE